MTAETAPINSVVDISPVASYKIGDTTVTVTNGKLSTTSAKIAGTTATLSYDSATKKVTASYSVTTTSTTTTGDPNTFNVMLPDDSTVKVTIDNGQISSVTQGEKTITAQDGSYLVGNYKLNFTFADNKLTATATT